MQRQWHHTKNQPLGDRRITASSPLRVWWSCDQCPCGLPHEWAATVSARQDLDTQCPFCTNNSLCQHNSLLTKAPAVAAYWDIAKNGLTPDQVMASSSTRRHWLCPLCGNSWQAIVFGKVVKNSGCPKCSNMKKPWNRQSSLTNSKHPAMLEFDFESNREQVLILTRSRQEAPRWCTGSVPNVLKANHTCLWPVHRVGLPAIEVALTVPANKLASATRCRLCTLWRLQSMTLPGMVLVLSRFCRVLTKWPSGRMQVDKPGNRLLQNVPSQKKIESSGRQSASGPSSSSKPQLTCIECAFVAMCLPCAIVLVKLLHLNRVVSDDSLLMVTLKLCLS